MIFEIFIKALLFSRTTFERLSTYNFEQKIFQSDLYLKILQRYSLKSLLSVFCSVCLVFEPSIKFSIQDAIVKMAMLYTLNEP